MKAIIEENKDNHRMVRLLIEGEAGAENYPEINKVEATKRVVEWLFSEYLIPEIGREGGKLDESSS